MCVCVRACVCVRVRVCTYVGVEVWVVAGMGVFESGVRVNGTEKENALLRVVVYFLVTRVGLMMQDCDNNSGDCVCASTVPGRVLLPSYSGQPFSEEGTGGAALENAPVSYEKSLAKKGLDARKCSSHNESARIRPKKDGQSKSVQQIEQAATSTATRQAGRQSPRKGLANAAATSFHADKGFHAKGRSTSKQPASKGGKAKETQAVKDGRTADVDT